MRVAAVLPIMLLLILLVVVLPVVLGVYTYGDAKKRGMNAVLWTLIVVLVPSLIGLVIYLIVRSNYSDLRCPVCETTVGEEYVACPACGAKLKETCENCGEMVEPSWVVCPHCARQLLHYERVKSPVRKKDKSLKVILTMVFVAVAIVLVALIGGAIFMYTGVSDVSSTGSSSINYEAHELTEIHFTSEELKDWYKECMTGEEEVYVLEYREVWKDGIFKVKQLVYRPNAQPGELLLSNSLSRKKIVHTLEREDTAKVYPWCMIVMESDQEAGPVTTVNCNGVETEAHVTVIKSDFTEDLDLHIYLE